MGVGEAGRVRDVVDGAEHAGTGPEAVAGEMDARATSSVVRANAWTMPTWLLITMSLLLLVFPLSALAVAYRVSQPPLRNPTYVVNRDGHYFVGFRCDSLGLTEIGLFTGSANVYGEKVELRTAVWHASSVHGVLEVELFADDQPGVKVSQHGTAPPDGRVTIISVGDDGHRRYFDSVLGNIGPGQADTATGIVSWAEYMNQRDLDYACR